MDTEEVATPAKKTTRARRTVAKTDAVMADISDTSATKIPGTMDSAPERFSTLINQLTSLKADYVQLQKQVIETKESWIREQKDHQRQVEERNQQEELQRKRDQEVYLYERERERKIAEDQFADKKAAWEKYLRDQKEALDKDRLELEELRHRVSTFEAEKQQATKEAQDLLQKQLAQEFDNDKRLREQEIKAEKEILNMRVTNLSSETARQSREIEALKKALDQTTQQVKDIAVKVIESGGSASRSQATTLG